MSKTTQDVFKDFKLLTRFEVKADTMHTPTEEGMGTDVIKIAGYANFSGKVEEGDVFIDLVGDVVVPSGIDVSIWKKNPQILLQHDRKCTIGKGLTVTKKPDGLYIEAEVHAGAMEEEDFYRIKSGLLSYFSVGFRTLSAEWKKVDGREVYFITKSLLLEVSVVGIPANSESAFQVIKALPDGDGFFAGEFKPKFEASAENTNTPEQGETMKLTARAMLPAAKIKELEALGMTTELDIEKEVSAAELLKAAVVLAKAEVFAELEAKAAEEAAEVARLAAEAEKTAAEEAAEAERLAAEAEKTAAEEAEKALTAGLIEAIANAKKELETE